MKQGKGATDDELEDIFGVSKSTIARYLKLYRNSGNVNCMTMGRPVESTVIAPDEQRVIIEIMLRQPDRRLLELQQEVGRVSGTVYSISAIQYYLRRNGITRKKDNAAIHHTPGVVNANRATGVLVLFLSAYSPDYMPCEGIFPLVKSWIKENDAVWHATDESEEFVFHAFMEVTNEDVVSFCRNAQYI
ncbi:predicted protein [Nematostella vectensis]|uniref:Transposase n=1 Tax=Nematostella vectensis TaxID=45351 RepID=A7SGI3_NEMVE|nr:predicted protein [Nematostella vectensis]|eukprot:XP_001629256.1 predicted protein [Nematostella vectensis]